MKLWLLRPIPHEGEDDHADAFGCPDDCPWKPWYDKVYGVVIRAGTAEQARELVEPGDEPRWAWLDAAHSSCTELTAGGLEGEVIRDFRLA
jgi:hypothetical protein